MKMFQSRKTKWRTLENAAKIFPATSSKRDERVFRFSCELTEDIQGEYLQQAVDASMEAFSVFSCVMRKGLFWNYLEESDLTPLVRREYKPPCSRLYERDRMNLLFEVTYYKARINLEVFHALTDGTGSTGFLQTIVYHYLMLIHPETVKGPLSRLNLDVTDTQKVEDGFKKYYTKSDKRVKIPRYHSFQFPYHKLDNDRQQIIEGVAPVSELLTVARAHHTTITVFLTAVFFHSIAAEMSPHQKRRPVAFMIPVNLRQFFPSESVRNFFGWIDIGYDFHKNADDLESLIAFVSDFFKKEITPERMAARMGSYVGIEQNLLMRLVPLELKLMFLQLGNWASTSQDTAIFSNVGKIVMPEECAPYIRLFDIFTSTPKTELSTCSFADNLMMTFATVYEDTTVMRNFFRSLTSLGIPVEIAARQ